LQRKAVHYDKGGEEHFNLISALHKSVRGSDPDAALYWLSRMLDAGEDPIYLARRLVRMALEDVGLADPMAVVEAIAALQSYQLLGSPEGDLALAQTAVYLALAPKSNALYTAFGKALELAGKTGAAPVPMHIRNAPTALLKGLGYGKDYHYPHDDPEGWVPEHYFPDTMNAAVLYEPTPRGWEGKRKAMLSQRRQMAAKTKKSANTDS
jgi:putative ATPase